MASLYLLIPLSVAFIGLSVWAMVWAIKSRQFENLDVQQGKIPD